MRDYIPDLTQRYPEGFGGVDMCEPRDPWDNFDMEDGDIPYDTEDGEVVYDPKRNKFLDTYPRHYNVSAYCLLDGRQFWDSIGAYDDKEMLRFFDKRNPECEIADWWCYEDIVKED